MASRPSFWVTAKSVEALKLLHRMYKESLETTEILFAKAAEILESKESEMLDLLLRRARHELADATSFFMEELEQNPQPSRSMIETAEREVNGAMLKMIDYEAELILKRRMVKKIAERLEEQMAREEEIEKNAQHNRVMASSSDHPND